MDSQKLPAVGLLKLAKAHPLGDMAMALGVLALAAVAALLGAPAARAANPVPSFTWSPAEPRTGDLITFTSTSTIPDGRTTIYSWDLDGNGTYEAKVNSPTAAASFADPGPHEVGMALVVNGFGALLSRQTVDVQIPVSIGMFPAAPLPGELVFLFADPPPPSVTYAWDLNGDGTYERSTGQNISVITSFATPGTYPVGLRVSEGPDPLADPFGTATRTVAIGPVAVTGARARLLSPFPVVRIAGRVGKRGARIRNLTITGPIGAKVTVRCRGRGCPFRRTTRTLGNRTKRARSSATVRVGRLERRFLRSGTRVEVSVTRKGAIGKFTRFTIRKRRPPARRDLCLVPGAPAPIACPPS